MDDIKAYSAPLKTLEGLEETAIGNHILYRLGLFKYTLCDESHTL